MKTTLLKLGVLQNNLTTVKTEINQENEHLDTSMAQVNAMIESLRSGLEKNLDWLLKIDQFKALLIWMIITKLNRITKTAISFSKII